MVTKWEQEYTDITSIDIDLSLCKLNIKKGDTLKVDASDVSEKFICKAEGKQLKIEDKKFNNWFFNMWDVTPEIIVYLPENINLKEVDIETGVNDTYIEYLEADSIKIEMGVGKYQIDELVADYAKIEAGAGEANIGNSDINELKLKGGIGKLVLTSRVNENADIECGMGKLDINLIGSEDDYKIKANTGLGNFEVDGQKVSDNQTVGSGSSIIKVESGVGETIVRFKEK